MSVPASWAVSACLVIVACSSGRTSPGEPGTPSPEPGKPTNGTPTPTGASGIIYLPVRDAGYALVRHDSLTLQLPGGANQLQLIDRTAYLRVSVAPDTNGYLATIVLDSSQALISSPALDLTAPVLAIVNQNTAPFNVNAPAPTPAPAAAGRPATPAPATPNRPRPQGR